MRPPWSKREKKPLTWKRLGLMLIRTALLVYLCACAYLYLRQEAYVFLPSRTVRVSPSDCGLSYEDLYLTADDGVRVNAWWIPHPDPRGTVLFCHGNAGNLGDRLQLLRLLHGRGFNCLAFDYRGYGRSDGQPDEEGTYRDAAAAWDHLVGVRGLRPEEIVLYGKSLGGAVAAQLATRRRPAVLILESTFTSIPDVARRHYPVFPVDLLAHVRYDTRARLPRIACPVLILHGEQDRLIPADHARALHAVARSPKLLLIHPGTHNACLAPADPAAADFLAAHLVSRARAP